LGVSSALNFTSPLRAWGIKEADLPGVAEKTGNASGMKANPIPLLQEELMTIVSAAR
jgi:alcohol dehydrogenase class IV